MLGGLGFYLFIVHMFTAEKPFVPRAMFKDRNFVSALILMFLVGVVILASSALLPPYLQNLSGYTVTDTGLLMAPRGIGVMLAMILVGRLSNRLDPRILLGFGSTLVLWSMWAMAHWTPSIDGWTVAWVTGVQGIGLGFVFIPANLVAFATLGAQLRTDASALLNLVRNIGSAIGVSVTTTVLADAMQTAHANMAAHVSTFNRALGLNAPSLFWNPQLPFGLQNLNAVINRNAAVIAYADDFLFMFFICLPVLVVIMMMRAPRQLAHAREVEVVE